MFKPYLVIMYGPTAVGKSQIALDLASDQQFEIVNMDVAQLYTPLSIGTAKPDWRNCTVPHHLFDLIDRPEHYTVVAYRKQVRALIHEIWSRKKIPLFVGGSGFYLNSLLFPQHEEAIAHSALSTDSSLQEYTWDELYRIDPVRAQEIDRNDAYRIIRALNIWKQTGKKPSTYAPQYNPIAPYMLIFIDRNRQELYERINRRVYEMMSSGFVKEVNNLIGTSWEPFLQDKKFIGYNELIDFLQTKNDDASALEKTIHAIKKRTRRYARKQASLWRAMRQKILISQKESVKNNKKLLAIKSVNLTLTDVGLYIKELKKDIISAANVVP